jgi:hypothetical protein
MQPPPKGGGKPGGEGGGKSEGTVGMQPSRKRDGKSAGEGGGAVARCARDGEVPKGWGGAFEPLSRSPSGCSRAALIGAQGPRGDCSLSAADAAFVRGTEPAAGRRDR